MQDGVQDQAWLWGWAWGPDSTVSIVDRSPPLTFLSRPAGFGADLTDPVLGYIIPLSAFTALCQEGFDTPNATLVEWNLGCPPLCLIGENVPDINEQWIALVQRGECQFVNKVREAQRWGAKAIVVGGDDPAENGNPDVLVNMYSPGDSSDVKIAATFIKFSDYVQLQNLIAASNTSHSGLRTLSMLISSEYSPWQWYSPIVTFITILFIPSSLTFLTLLIHRIRAARAAQLDRAPVDLVHGLPWRVWTGSAWEKHEGNPDAIDAERGEGTAHHVDDDEDPAWFLSQVECIICLENFVKGDRVRVLPCKHIFHLKEVDEWLIQRKKLCPICKADVTKPANHPHPHTTVHADPATLAGLSLNPSFVASSAPATERTPLLPRPSTADS
ncbi:hypothetical protein K488DRAFT_40943 [Vararia minispora EC-137]|uniref:Uncharacterized protein n=1 Tax=Vararia minispora EC-137 TaxID=1314806 RepID=A0ACB8QXX6_9AGAM|nr:hypothetical protein K488DRAFT_40943 [Vararia minispora EC-137]